MPPSERQEREHQADKYGDEAHKPTIATSDIIEAKIAP
jgi:hypothetical protein